MLAHSIPSESAVVSIGATQLQYHYYSVIGRIGRFKGFVSFMDASLTLSLSGSEPSMIRHFHFTKVARYPFTPSEQLHNTLFVVSCQILSVIESLSQIIIFPMRRSARAGEIIYDQFETLTASTLPHAT